MATGPEFTAVGPRDALAPAKNKSHHGFWTLLLLIALALGGAILYELSERKTQARELAAEAAGSASAGPASVNVARVRLAPSEATVDLPGQTVAQVETPVYARTDGYIKQRTVEMGDRVKKGQLMVELDTPDLDQQIEQARATLAQSQAALAQLQAALAASQSNLKLARVTAQRTESLADEGILSKQDRDTAVAGLVPIYFGRVASFVIESRSLTTAQAEERVERLARTFELLKPYLVEGDQWG